MGDDSNRTNSGYGLPAISSGHSGRRSCSEHPVRGSRRPGRMPDGPIVERDDRARDRPRPDRVVPDEGTLPGSVLRHDEHVGASAAGMVWH